jgi:hypothetical protein
VTLVIVPDSNDDLADDRLIVDKLQRAPTQQCSTVRLGALPESNLGISGGLC